MADPDRDDIATPQREVQRLLGRCLIRIQQYERLLKAIVALQEISVTTQTLPHSIDARRAEPSDKRSEEHTSVLQSLMRHPDAVFCLKPIKNAHHVLTPLTAKKNSIS